MHLTDHTQDPLKDLWYCIQQIHWPIAFFTQSIIPFEQWIYTFGFHLKRKTIKRYTCIEKISQIFVRWGLVNFKKVVSIPSWLTALLDCSWFLYSWRKQSGITALQNNLSSIVMQLLIDSMLLWEACFATTTLRFEILMPSIDIHIFTRGIIYKYL